MSYDISLCHPISGEVLNLDALHRIYAEGTPLIYRGGESAFVPAAQRLLSFLLFLKDFT